MRIALNMIFVGSGVAGGRVYCEGLLQGLQQVDNANEYTIFTRRGLPLPPVGNSRFRQFHAPVSMTSSLWRTFWEFCVMPQHVRRGSFDVLHGLGTISPSAGRCPLVLTIHDLIYHHSPTTLPRASRTFMELFLPGLARRAARIIVPSRATARDVIEHFHVPEDRLRTITYGPGQHFRYIDDVSYREAVKK